MKPVALLLAAALAVATPAAAQDRPSSDEAWLFVVQGTVTAIRSGAMALDADRTVVAFTERPDRRARLLPLVEFVASAWAEGGDFRTEPPNASLVDETAGGIGIVTLTSAALSDRTLTLGFVAIEGALPAAGDRIALTIDVMHPTQY
jgi:hypothetical protein